jgi:hypothetical protein
MSEHKAIMLCESTSPDPSGRYWHIYRREDGSITVYVTRPNEDAHYVVFDSLDMPDPLKDITAQSA